MAKEYSLENGQSRGKSASPKLFNFADFYLKGCIEGFRGHIFRFQVGKGTLITTPHKAFFPESEEMSTPPPCGLLIGIYLFHENWSAETFRKKESKKWDVCSTYKE